MYVRLWACMEGGMYLFFWMERDQVHGGSEVRKGVRVW